MKTKILILHTSVGYGIKVTAQNVYSKLIQDSRFEVRISDIQEVESGISTRLTEKIYVTILDHISGLWGFLYNSRLVTAIALPLRKFIASFKTKKTLDLLREFQPAIVISTQAAPSGAIAYLKSKGLYNGKLVIVFSDYHLHPFWVFDEADLYICNIAEQVGELKKLGVAKEKIALTGMITADKFFDEIPKQEACLTLGLLTSMPTVLLTSGGRARGVTKEIFLRLLRSPKSFQVVVVAGKNEELKKEMSSISAPARHPVKVFGYVNNMEVLMSAADLLVGKVGGPTMAEAVTKRLPMVLTDVRAGHEEANLNYLVYHNIVVHGRNPREVAFLVEQVLAGEISFDQEANFERLLKPAGSISLSEAVEGLLPNQDQPATIASKVRNYQDNL